MRIFLTSFLLFSSAACLQSQDTNYARVQIKELCSNKYYGRGYYKNGAYNAANYIGAEMQKVGLKMLPGQRDYFQFFTFPVNVIQNIDLTYTAVKGMPMRLISGADYIINADAKSGSWNLSGKISVINNTLLEDSNFSKKLIGEVKAMSNAAKRTYFIDTLSDVIRKNNKKLLDILDNNCNTIELIKNKLTWTVSTEQSSLYHLKILKKSLPNIPIATKLKVKSRLINTTQRNVLGYVPGTEKPDSFIFITAHYDHLGMMGKTAMFAGANDNACGVAMLLDMAKYYVQNPGKYSMVFVAFAGEEAGLIGSRFYTDNPIVPLNNIKFLFNLDLVGTGEDGGTVVNGSIFKTEFALLDSINKQYNYLPKILTRGKAANSDHYFFTEAGVHSFFLYLAGPRPYYHDIFDTEPSLTLFGYNQTFKLIDGFFRKL